MKDALLDYIFENSDIAYISDLRQKLIFQEYADIIFRIDDHQFSVQEWNYVYQYLTGEDIEFSAVSDVKKALQKWQRKYAQHSSMTAY